MKKSGIYCIENLKTKEKYIGQTINLNRRKYIHFWSLKEKRHFNKNLQISYNNYGKESFSFKILIYCEPFELSRYEQFFIDLCDPIKLYNICLDCVDSTKGVIPSEETRKKISKATSGKNNPMWGRKGELSPRYKKKFTEEHKNKLSDARIGKNNGMVGKNHYAFGKKSKGAVSNYYGVSFDKSQNTWKARVSMNGKTFYIGRYKEEIIAAKSYDKYVVKNNFPHPLNFDKEISEEKSI